ncbi:hypothetical protein [Pontibacter pudoricolor]|uniref:hypothetical protein n=1 Tax=Pontibacter pudoricolor TaxID=2694930 RepID=UPI0013907BA6|nr:hypothetical protein [Pontibacter pudoricolor]
MSKIYLKSKDRIKMFINEYYFGYNYGIMLMRLLMGPVLFLIGLGHTLMRLINLGLRIVESVWLIVDTTPSGLLSV